MTREDLLAHDGVCAYCAAPGVPLKLDKKGCLYVACGGCRTRTFFRTDAAASGYVESSRRVAADPAAHLAQANALAEQWKAGGERAFV
jgi:hypothetical protein